MEEQFKRYIASRGIDPGYAIPRYDLRWCAFGYYAYRLVIPVIHQGVWWTWQARTINDHEVRFLAAQTKDSDKRKADTANKPNDFLFDGDNLKGGRLLVLCEGAWDAIKINSAMIPGVSATALYGKVLMPKQMTKLIEVSQGYDKVAIGLDKDAYVDSLKLRDRLQWYVPSVTIATPNDKDWGVMKQSDIKKDLVAVC
jgi:5S rRNA maturation endonuclease (ribonuclease M5)